MSQLKLTADSGGGTVAIKGPASTTGNAAIELTVPGTGSGTLAVGDTGKILQVVSTTKTDTASFASANTSNFTDISGLSVSITPSSTSSKILVVATVAAAVGTGSLHVRLARDSTGLAVGDSSSNRLSSTMSRRSASSIYNLEITPMSFNFLDSPNTTSATTYKVQATAGSTYDTTVYVNRSSGDNDYSYGARVASTITVMEVAV